MISRLLLSLVFVIIVAFGVGYVSAQATAQPSHVATAITPGAFRVGAFQFPGALTIGTLFGAGLPSCSGATQKLLYNSGTGTFSCGTDNAGGGSGSCTQLGIRTSTFPHIQTVPEPACMRAIGGCRLVTVAYRPDLPGSMGMVTSHFVKDPVNPQWISLGTYTRSGTLFFTGSFQGTPETISSLTLLDNGDNLARCMIKDDSTGIQLEITAQATKSFCEFYLCP